jgi:drug/metabolite transporter (DMT)-like permease
LLGSAGVVAARSSIEVDSIAGILLAVGALVGMTIGMLYEKRFGISQHPITANLVQYLVGLMFCGPMAFAFEDTHIVWSTTFMVAIAYLVIFNSLIAISLLLAMIRAGEAARVSALFFFVPPAAALIAWVTLHEAMPPLAWAGMAVAAAGVAIATRA